MSLLIPGFRYSTHPAPVPGEARLTITVDPQIPPRQPSVATRKGIRFRDGLRMDLFTPTAAGPHPLVVYVPGGGFVRAPRGLARRNGRSRQRPDTPWPGADQEQHRRHRRRPHLPIGTIERSTGKMRRVIDQREG